MSKVCRGCGGNGIGQHVPPRKMQVIEASMPVVLTRVRSVEISLDENTPLAVFIQKLAERQREAFLPKGPHLAFVEMLLDEHRALACRWCHGTGVPQLSVNALEIGVA